MVRLLRQAAVLLVLAAVAFAQDYTPKFPGDPARSNSEAAALGYMRVVVNAQRQFHKKHDQYATSLSALVNQGSFTKRMVSPNRGDYTSRFKSDGKTFSLWMTPTTAPDPTHRAFYVDDRGTIRTEEDKPATSESPAIKTQK